MRAFYFLFLIAMFYDCYPMSKRVCSRSREEVMPVIDRYSKELKKEGIVQRWHGLIYAGRDKVYDGKIHEISLGYSFDQSLKYQEARELFYRIVDDLLIEINSREYLREYFFHYPITYQDLHFDVGFDWEHKGHLKKDDVNMISMGDDVIFYAIANYDGASNKLVFHETYPGMGTVTNTGRETMRFIMRQLPESEEETNTSKTNI